MTGTTLATTLANSAIYITADGTAPATLDAVGFAALTWVKIKGVITYPDITDTEEDVTYSPIDEPVTQHAKGTTTYDGMDIECVSIPGDTGQSHLSTAKAAKTDWNFKYEMSDGVTIYRRGPVSQLSDMGGEVNDIKMITATMLPNVHVRVVA